MLTALFMAEKKKNKKQQQQLQSNRARDTLLDSPFALIFPVAWMVATSIPSAAVRDLDSQSRQTAVVDQLTGLLNRVALGARVAELAHQTTMTAAG